MRNAVKYFVAAIALLLASSCERRPLIELEECKYNIVFDYKRDIVNDRIEQLPEIMRVLFFNSESESFMQSDFLPQQGGEVVITPLTYNIITYNFNTESTIINNYTDYLAIEATTNQISEYELAKVKYALQTREDIRQSKFFKTKGESEDRVLNQPDYLFHKTKESVKLQYSEDVEQTIKLETTSIVEKWIVEIKSVIGAEYLSEASMIISGAVPSVKLATREKASEKISLIFDLNINETTGILHGEFKTFGMHPLDETDPQLLTVILIDKLGKQYHLHYKLTKEIFFPKEQKLSIIDDIKITPPEGGGFDPEVDDWDDIETDIII